MKKNGKHRFYRNKFAINFGRLEIFASYQGRYMYMCVYIYIYMQTECIVQVDYEIKIKKK